MPTKIIVRKSAHALVVAERRVPYLLSTESNIPSFTVTIRIPKVTSTVIRKLPPNILGKHQLVVNYVFIEYELDQNILNPIIRFLISILPVLVR